MAQRLKEAEFVALAMKVREAMWFQKFESVLNLALPKHEVAAFMKMSIGEESQAFMREAKNPIVLESLDI